MNHTADLIDMLADEHDEFLSILREQLQEEPEEGVIFDEP